MRQKLKKSLKAISRRLKEKYNAQKVILYGSYAKGKATRHSDVDLLVVAPTKENLYWRMANTLAAVRDESRGIPLSPIVLTPQELKKRIKLKDPFISTIVKEGVEL